MFLVTLLSCQDEAQELAIKQNLVFTGEISEREAEISTRGPVSELVQRKNFDTKFYFERKVGDSRKCSTYIIPDQRAGVFNSFGTKDSLVWSSRNEPHTFYAWTMPWLSWENKDPYMDEFEDGTTISFNPAHEMYNDVNEEDNTNCKILETFIGAKAGPINFLENGEYVNMQFKHLVSKIYIERLRLNYISSNTGNLSTTNLEGTMILYNVPSEGVFYREGEKGPMVEAKADAENQISYKVGPGATLYICPGVDITKIEFRIVDHNYRNGKGDFFGDFHSITIERNTDEDWWDEENPDNNILYAGEMLTLRISLRQGIGSIVAAAIDGWDTKDVREGSTYGKAGFYDESNLRYIYDTLNGHYDKEDYSELEERMFDLYGDEVSGEYHLYEDLTGVSHGLRLGKEHVLNGMGHSITFDTYSDGSIRISKVKDIYLCDKKGNVVYIDENFNVYKVNPDGSMEHKGQLPDLEDGMNSYNINLATGAFYQTNLY